MLTLVLGGARSGKSRYAQSLCAGVRPVIFVATARLEEADAEMRVRVERHRAERPPGWLTVEEPLGVGRVTREASPRDAIVLVDCVTLWVANLVWEHRGASDADREVAVLAEVEALAQVAHEREVVAVSNETGWGVVPENPVGRSFRDLLGLANQCLARHAGRVVLMVAGLPLGLK